MELSTLISGDPNAWRTFVDAHAPIVLATVRRVFARYGRAQDVDGHEDISQDVFLKLSRNDFRLLRQFDPEKAKLTTYVGVVARSTAIDHLRRRKPQTEDIDDHADHIPADSDGQSFGTDPAKLAERQEAQGVDKMIAKLPPGLLSAKQLSILSLLFDHDLEPDEVAQQMGVEAQTIRSAKHKALSKIRTHLASLPLDERPF